MKLRLKGHRLTVVGVALPLSLILLAASTFAWFTAADSVRNKLHAGEYEFSVPAVDVFTPPATPMEPGDSVEKRVGAVNSGSLPGFVRLMVLPTVVAADGKTMLPASLGKEVVAALNVQDWADGGDGYYYYLRILHPTEATPELFTEVQIASDLGDRYKQAKLDIEVKSEAVGVGQWDYRVSWWGSDAAQTAGPLAVVDAALQEQAR
ncbi:MAG: SipW-dependent-type signal peptide-containing protein [Propionibacteriaceae bacterium]|jgi:predicted ribosomally synthesized peptide with SipW-like signal peptide|nr:SipW-dependent-type signal peptide-containing protein [Propionibacteriaceae bacterium]